MTRIYKVTVGGKPRLIKTPNKAQAVNHVAADTITAEVASQDDLVRLIGEGVRVEVPGGAQEPTNAAQT